MTVLIFSQQNRAYYRFWFQLIRPLTLTGTITPMFVGTLIAAQHRSIEFTLFVILLVATLLIQMATNIWNDYFDYKQGQDKMKWRQIQGSKLSPAHNALPYVAILFTCIAAIMGMWLAFATTYWLIPVGVFGILFGFYYSAGERSLSAQGFGEIIGVVFLGFTTTLLPYLVQGNRIDLEIILVAVPFACLIASMILTNNIRDIKKDTPFRKTIALRLGKKRAMVLLISLLAVTYFWVIGLEVFTTLSPWIPITFFALPLTWQLWKSLKGETATGKCMKLVAIHHWAFGLLFSLGLLLGFI